MAYLALFYLVWILRATVFYSIDSAISSRVLRVLYSSAVKLIIWVFPAFIYLNYIEKKAPFLYLKLSTPPRKKGLVYAIIGSVLFFSGMILLEYAAAGKTLRSLFHSSRLEWFMVFLFVSVSPLAEEVLFRGFIQGMLSERVHFWVANTITSLLFVLIHWPHWFWSQGFQISILRTSLAIFVLALFMGYLVKLTNSLWPSVGVHIINNVISHFLRV